MNILVFYSIFNLLSFNNSEPVKVWYGKTLFSKAYIKERKDYYTTEVQGSSKYFYISTIPLKKNNGYPESIIASNDKFRVKIKSSKKLGYWEKNGMKCNLEKIEESNDVKSSREYIFYNFIRNRLHMSLKNYDSKSFNGKYIGPNFTPEISTSEFADYDKEGDINKILRKYQIE